MSEAGEAAVSLRVAELAHDEAQRYADRLSRNLDDFRLRTGTLFSVAVLATTLFIQVVRTDLRFFSWAAIVAFLAVAVLSIKILWPIKETLTFGLSPSGIFDNTEPGTSDEKAVSDAAESLAENLTSTEKELERIATLVQAQCGVLALEILLWTIDLAGR
jgi:hypothetical protein